MLDCRISFHVYIHRFNQLTFVKSVKDLILWLDHVVNKVYIDCDLSIVSFVSAFHTHYCTMSSIDVLSEL